MKNTFLITLMFVFGSCLSFSQTLGSNQSQTRALVIGISDYQDDNIPDLRFANKDAEAFVAYLQSPSGGSLPKDNITLLTNSEATGGAMVGAMDWLIQESKAGDKAIIYFSGHGDVETRTNFQRGFLLPYDSPPNNYMIGAFALVFLQDIITTLSSKEVQVIMISDACRAGKLAGSDIGGAQATAANLSKQFANEIKILSCQPDEFSLEGEQWGGGRGAFSYHLIDGLTGLADGNEDLKVNLFETGRYLEDKVPAETAPQMQIPMTIGSKSTVLSFVDETSLAAVKERKENELPVISTIDTRGFEEVVLADLDSIWQQKYEQFTAALDKGQLLEPAGSSAYDLYTELAEVEKLERLQGIMKRNLATALQEESQQAINAYLRADEAELAAQARGELKYTKFVRYLEKAAELLGESHYMYKTLKAKQYYFDAVDIRVRIAQRTGFLADSMLILKDRWTEKIEKAIALEENAAYIQNEMGLSLDGSTELPHIKKAMELAPKWVIPYVSMARHCLNTGQIEKAQEYAHKALELAPGSSLPYHSLGMIHYFIKKEHDKGIEMFSKAVEIAPENTNYLSMLGSIKMGLFSNYNMEKTQEAEALLLKALKLDPGNVGVQNGLFHLYQQQLLDYEKSIAFVRERLEKRPTDGDAYGDLICHYEWYGENDKLTTLVKELEQLNDSIKNWEDGQSILGVAYSFLGDLEKAENYGRLQLKAAPNNVHSYYYMSMIVAKQNPKLALQYIDTALMMGLPHDWINIDFDTDLTQLSSVLEFETFARKWGDYPHVGFGHSLLGKYYAGQGNYKAAAEAYEKAMEIEPNNTLRYINAGRFYACFGAPELAIARLKQVQGLDKVNREIYWYLAWSQFIAGNPEEAFSTLEKGINMQPSDGTKAWLLSMKGLLHHYAGQNEQRDQSITAAFEKSEKMAPFQPVFQAIEKDDFQQAQTAIEQAQRIVFFKDYLWYLRCQVSTSMGKYDEALVDLEKAIRYQTCSFDFIQKDVRLKPLREMAKFKKLMRQYFPEK